ncbi:MAG: TIGR03905 family TSCPD domain-containing protein [Clostridia bacterium]|nr:TIGR03905 family TSCPD domain-containing protein [Clostridia bacterium]
MKYSVKPKGVCASLIEFDLDDGIVKDIKFTHGCNGNSKGISALAEGMEATEVIKRLKGIKCGFKNTSCPDQLATVLEEITKE